MSESLEILHVRGLNSIQPRATRATTVLALSPYWQDQGTVSNSQYSQLYRCLIAAAFGVEICNGYETE